MSGPEVVVEALPGAVGAVAGSGLMAWLTKILLSRMVAQYDKRHDHHTRKIEAMNEKMSAALTRIAVLETVLEDARRLRIDLEQRFAMLRGEHDAKIETMRDEINDLRRDIFVAHERLRCLAAGDMEISKVQAPPIVRRR